MKLTDALFVFMKVQRGSKTSAQRIGRLISFHHPPSPVRGPHPKHYTHDKMKTAFQVNTDTEAHGKQAQSYRETLDVASRADEDIVLLIQTQTPEINRKFFL